jgi:precorrin-2 methylase
MGELRDRSFKGTLFGVFDLFETVVLVKLHRTFHRVLCALDALGLTEKAVLVDRAAHPGGGRSCAMSDLCKKAEFTICRC